MQDIDSAHESRKAVAHICVRGKKKAAWTERIQITKLVRKKKTLITEIHKLTSKTLND
jgi:hypothetical protein